MTTPADRPTRALWAAPTATGPIVATVGLPGSKSLTNRELVLAATATGPGVVRGALRSRDTDLMAAALTRLGSPIDTSGPDWTVTPGIIGASGDTEVDCGLAGTVMRFIPAIAALRTGRTTFDGDPYARKRPMDRTIDSLRHLGVEVVSPTGTLPFTIVGTGEVHGGVVELDASASSQFISALLLAAPHFGAGVDIRHRGPAVPSLPHIEMTVAALRDRGVGVDDTIADRWVVRPGSVAATDVRIEPDLSNAAPFLMLALTSNGRITVPHWPAATTQGGDALRHLLTRMGADVTWEPGGLTVAGRGGITGLDIDLHEVGELVPTLAALAVLADSPSRLRGVAHIRGHETDRLRALTAELCGLGADVVEEPDGLTIRPAPLHGGTFRTYADHRMAQAAAVIGSAVPGVMVEDIETTAKTFPGFETVWAGLFDR